VDKVDTLLVCSKSTKKFLEADFEHIFVVEAAPTDISALGFYESVVAIGGGAVIDTAKILSKTPIKCYPTTGAGSAVTSWAVYWDGPRKCSVRRYKPSQVEIVDEFAADLPMYMFRYSLYDVISHCLDSMWSINATVEIVDRAIDILGDIKYIANPSALVKLGNAAGELIEVTGTNLLHALSYPLTGFYGVPHGKALGYLLPSISKYMGVDIPIMIGELDITLDEEIDINLVVDEAFTYGKVHEVDMDISRTILKDLLNEV